GTVKVDQGAVA
ncbi:hypothetical protein MKD33_12680, partial [Chromobacterium piscinae]